MTARTASCRCGQLRATVTGEPVRVSVCQWVAILGGQVEHSH